MPPKQKVEVKLEDVGVEEVKEETPTVIDLTGGKKRKRQRPNDSDSIPKAAFKRMVREIAEAFKPDLRWEADALEALQVDAEAYLTTTFHKANKARSMCKHLTLGKDHWKQAVTNL